MNQEFGGRGVVELEYGFGRLEIPTDCAAHAARGVKGLATMAARAAHADPRAAAHHMASPAVYTPSLSRKAALRSGAAVAAMMTAHIFFGRASKAFLAILVPERQG
jgi:hypothetical protein